MQSPEQEEEDGGGVEESPAEGEEPWCAAAAEGWVALKADELAACWMWSAPEGVILVAGGGAALVVLARCE